MPNISINGKTCFYQDQGEGYPLLLGHSYLWDSAMWRPQIDALSQEFRCIAVDLWSHGQSECLDTKKYEIDQLAQDYWMLMQTLNIPEFAVVGLSVGGMWGAHLALTHPQSVTALVLMGTYLGSEPLMAKLKYHMLLDIIEGEHGFSTEILDKIVPLFFSPFTHAQQPHLIEHLRRSLASLKRESIPGIVALGRGIFSRKCLLKQLSSLRQPTLVLTGKDDIPRPPKEAEEMAKLLPNGELIIMENAGHISNLEQPDHVSTLLLNFLKKACTS